MEKKQLTVDFTESVNRLIDELEASGFITAEIDGANKGRARLLKKKDDENTRMFSFIGHGGAEFNFEICMHSLAANPGEYVKGLFEVLEQAIKDLGA